MLKKRGIKFTSNRQYPDSNYRYDFHLTDYCIYIEICGMLFMDEYIDKIYDKMEKFDPIVLTSVEEFEPFLNELI